MRGEDRHFLLRDLARLFGGYGHATLKASTARTMLHWLGLKPSYSRPRVSDDNAFAKALLRSA